MRIGVSSFRWISILVIAAITLAEQKAGTIVFTHAPEGRPPWPVEDVYVMDADGANVRALTHDGHSHDATWSPDGDHVLYVHDAALQTPMPNEQREFVSHHPIELYVMNRDGSGSRLLWKSEFPIFGAAWSPDGKVLAVSTATKVPANASEDDPMRSGLFLLSSDGHSAPRMLVRDALTPAWSPDGKQLAFSKERPKGQWTIHLVGADGSNDRQLTEPPLTAGSPVWSPDGTLIAFDAFADPRHQQVFVMQPDGSHRRQITTISNWSCGHPSWSSEGRRIVFACSSASTPCGMVSSVGELLPECTRRLFSIAPFDLEAKPIQLGERDGMIPQFEPSH